MSLVAQQFPALDLQRFDLRKAEAIERSASRPEKFRPEFPAWLGLNWHVYLEFERRALRVWQHGGRHFGARMIAETIRYDTAIRELAGEYKINNHNVPDMARLFEVMNPGCTGLFELRSSKLRVI